MTIQLYNSLSRKKEPFEPIEEGAVRLYVCGPTVYDSAHIGHAMSYLVFDTIRRYLEHRGYRVRHVQNFTDVEDKIIARARETGESWESITTRYIDDFLRDMDDLNVLRAHEYPYASREIPEIIRMVEGLIEKGYAYPSGGDVFFRVERDEDYGKLSRRRLDEQKEGERLSDEERTRKEHPLDFVLWKGAKKGEPSWESPWGPGRPGWHIECSAMVHRYLGEQIDIHGGGHDLLFPHHENEIAQSESFTGATPFARYWIHNGLLQVSGEKMSKSLKNFFTINAFLEHHSADALRLFVLSNHYRRPATYTDESFAAAERAVERFRTALEPARADADADEDAELEALVEGIQERFHAAMDDDFNSALALGALFELARAINGARDRGLGPAALEPAQAALKKWLGVLGFTLAPRRTAISDADVAPFIELLIETREKLREAKQWALADGIRDGLAELDVRLEDSADGTRWTLG